MNIIIISTLFVSVIASRYSINKDVTNHPNWYLMDHEQCGESFQDRIIGGTKAALGEYPWMARIGSSSTETYPKVFYTCGGAIINNLYVLTAAHCVVNQTQGSYIEHIRLGEYDARTEVDCDSSGVCSSGTQDIRPAKILVHKDVNSPFSYIHDIALIRLKDRIIMSEFVRPVCLPHGKLLSQDLTGSMVDVAGWGLTDVQRNQRSDVLLKVILPVLNIEKCIRTFPNVGRGQICIGGNKGYDSCGGDSGGPVVKVDYIDDKSPKYYIYGLVSFGDPQCGSKNPAVYVDVRRYLIWILDNMIP